MYSYQMFPCIRERTCDDKVQVYGVFTLHDSDSYTDSYEMYKGYIRTDSDGDTDNIENQLNSTLSVPNCIQ